MNSRRRVNSDAMSLCWFQVVYFMELLFPERISDRKADEMKRTAAIVALLFVVIGFTQGQKKPTRADLEKELIGVDESWMVAAQKADAAALNRIIADDYIMTTASGEVKNKEQYVSDFVSGVRKDYSLIAEDYRVRVYGEVAVLTHGGITKAEYQGRDTSGRYRWTHIFVRRDARWVCVANHVTRLAQQ
jgi:uncharacterized protein (TIGR02246 family)